jgi:hypothetical protein
MMFGAIGNQPGELIDYIPTDVAPGQVGDGFQEDALT